MSHRRLLPAVLAALLLAGTLAVATVALRNERARADDRSAAGAARAADITRLGGVNATSALGNAAGLFDASEEVTSRDFAVFARRVLGRGGMSAVAWLPRVTGADREAYEARTGREITEPAGDVTRRAPARTAHFPVAFVASLPWAGPVPLGVDTSTDPARRQALARAALRDAPVATGPVTLMGSRVSGVIIYQPVYADGAAPPGAATRGRALRGFVVGAFPLAPLTARIISTADTAVPVEIRDGDVLLSAPAAGAAEGTHVDVEVAGRRWTVSAGRPAPSLTMPIAILVGGAALTMLAVLLAVAIGRRERFAAAAVDRATTELRESRRSHRALSENSPDIVARYDRDLRCTYVNAAVIAATGLAPARFLGRTSAETGIPEEPAGVWEAAMRRTFAGEEDVEVDLSYPSPGGARILQSRLAAEHGPGGQVENVLVVTRDVTRQTLAEHGLRASEHRYRVLLESLSDGVVVQDAAGRIVSCNPAAEIILGVSADQLNGRLSIDPRWRAVRDNDTPLPDAENPAMVTLRTGAPQDGVVLGVHRPDDSLAWLAVSTRPLDDDGERQVVCCFTDITARVEAGREQAALRRVATRVAAADEPPEVLELVARETVALVGAEAAGVIRFTDAGRTGTIAGVHAPHHLGAEPGDATDLAQPTASGRVAATGRAARVGGGAPANHDSLIPGVPIASAVAAPIHVGGRVWGALSAATTRAAEPLGPGTEDRLERLAELIGLAITSADARAQLATLAATDHLTGLPNRRAFTEALPAETERSRRYGHDLSLVMLDIDHFKRINDSFGHPAGDRVLMAVAARLFGMAREGELVARVGGEEFAWILPHASGDEAVAAADRMRESIAGMVIDGVGALTVSMGVCDLRDAGSAADLMREADAALYLAKERGRDRVARHQPGVLLAIAGTPPA